ncbi:hypothetical protein CASFOL_011067 [Castilleja foliolosa]|uniref:BHLH domain-containing protein n=1 Tax=Castilleja foliolosa TaxID=1961234 RepID=A0ABD3DWE9_9LAMI
MNNNEEIDENNTSETESDYDSDESDTPMVKEKIESLRQLLPDCFKNNTSSTILDDAISYLKTIQLIKQHADQVTKMTVRTGFAIPINNVRGGNGLMGMPCIFPSSNYPILTSHPELSNARFFVPSTTPAIPVFIPVAGQTVGINNVHLTPSCPICSLPLMMHQRAWEGENLVQREDRKQELHSVTFVPRANLKLAPLVIQVSNEKIGCSENDLSMRDTLVKAVLNVLSVLCNFVV